MNFTLVGAGAIGTLFGIHLHQSGHQIQFWTRETSPTLNRQLNDQPTHTFRQNCPDFLKSSDAVIICLKACMLDTALTKIHQQIPEHIPIIFSHNGMGTNETIHQYVSNHPLLFASTSQACLRLSPSQFIHTGHGKSYLGALNSRGADFSVFATIFHTALPDWHWHNEIAQIQWEKLAVNALINPLTAIHNCNNGRILHSDFREHLICLSQEIEKIAKAEQINLQAEHISKRVLDVAEKTKANFSSMHQDIVHLRQTEIEFISGYLLKMAKKHQIQLPHHAILYQKIKQLEHSYG